MYFQSVFYCFVETKFFSAEKTQNHSRHINNNLYTHGSIAASSTHQQMVDSISVFSYALPFSLVKRH